MFILAILFAAVFVGAIVAWRRSKKEPITRISRLRTRITAGVMLAALALAAMFGFFSTTYTQDAGEANVLKDITGNIVGQNNDTGLQYKAPWVETVLFDIRNQQVIFAGDGEAASDNNRGIAQGPQITVQDKDGVSSNIDIALRYSIKPAAVTEIYTEFRDEKNFKASFIEQDVRSVVRLVPNQFSTLDLLTKRGEVEAAIEKALVARWEDDGIIVDSISLQEIRPPAEVVASYGLAQQAQINVVTETANLEAEKVKAQQKVVNAQADSDANALLAASLTPNILAQRTLDTYAAIGAKGNLIIVPEGFNGLVNVSK